MSFIVSFILSIITWPFRLVGSLISSVLVLLVVATGTLGIAGYFGHGLGPHHQWALVFDLASHFRLQYVLVQLLCLVGFLMLRDRLWLVTTLLLLAVNLYDIAPYYSPYSLSALDSHSLLSTAQNLPVVKDLSASLSGTFKVYSGKASSKTASAPVSATTSDSSHTLSVMQWNVLAPNRQSEAFIRYVQAQQPDIIALEEVTNWWVEHLNTPLKAYPYRQLLPQEDCFGLALYSRYPITRAEVRYFGGVRQPTAMNHLFGHRLLPDNFPGFIATLQVRQHPVHVIVIHPPPPFTGFDTRNAQLAGAAHYIRQLQASPEGHPPKGHMIIPQPSIIVMGDFNNTPWSVYFKDFLKESGLKDSQWGQGYQPSWPNFSAWLGPADVLLRIPIDHVLVSPQMTVLSRALGPNQNLGSDHLPVFTRVSLHE